MLPTSLVGSYQQYKSDTDSIAAWLASTAKSCGYVPANETPKPASQGRLKGKARAEAKKQNASMSSSKKHIIKIKDFVPLAEFVASKRSVSVPNSLITTLRRVIVARGGFGERLAEKGASIDESSDYNHSYFIGILERVEEILKPRIKCHSTSASSIPDKNKKPSATTTDGISNQFASLNVYDPSEDFLEAPEFERPEKPKEDNAAYEAEIFTTFADATMAVAMLLDDINKIRDHIGWIWINCKVGLFDLAAAAITTNTAIDLARNLMQEVMPLMEEHGGLEKFLKHFYALRMMASSALGRIAPDDDNCSEHDKACSTYYTIYNYFKVLTTLLPPGAIPLPRKDIISGYDPRKDWDSLTNREKFTNDQILIGSFIAELIGIIRGFRHLPVKDELLRGIEEWDDTRTISFYLVFATQIFLDIHRIMRESVDQGFKTLETSLNIWDHEIDEHMKFHEEIKLDGWGPKHDKMMRDVQSDIRTLLEDPIVQERAEWYREVGEPIPDSILSNQVLRMSPVLSGLALFKYRTLMWEIGINIVNAGHALTYSQHLYNALQQENLKPENWPDREIVRAVLDDSNFYVGNLPENAVEYYKKFNLQLGTTAVALTGKRRKNTPLKSRTGYRHIKAGAPVSSMFLNRYRDGLLDQADWTPEQIAKIVELGSQGTEGSGKGSEEDSKAIVPQVTIPEDMKHGMKALAKKCKKSPNTTRLQPERLIQSLMFALHVETLELSFPYSAMHRQCYRLLQTVKERCGPLLLQIFGLKYEIPYDQKLPFIVGWIFQALAEREDNRPLIEARNALSPFLQANGDEIFNTLARMHHLIVIRPRSDPKDKGDRGDKGRQKQ
ncbi:hypothetical protein F5Y04DRAFT_287511 [Hypomontagnella monticulosa]|nr:hypothetical protein F5Y04DRAFT_287511 [Hypomontagnella monticulosa]